MLYIKSYHQFMLDIEPEMIEALAENGESYDEACQRLYDDYAESVVDLMV